MIVSLSTGAGISGPALPTLLTCRATRDSPSVPASLGLGSQLVGGLVPFSRLWKVTFASSSELIADASSTDEPTASPALSAIQESDHGLPLVHHSRFLWNSSLAPHPPSHLLCLLSFLNDFHAGLYFLDVLTSHSIIKHRTHAGPFLQAGADLWDFRPKVMWGFSHV